MPSDPSLLQQLANRAKRFHSRTNIAQSTISRAIQVEESNYSSFLAGKRGLSAESTCRLLEVINAPAQAIAKFNKVSTSRIIRLQESGKRRKLDTRSDIIQTAPSPSAANPDNQRLTLEGIHLTSHIAHFQGINDGSWVSGLLGSGTDPNDAAIVVVPTGVKRKEAPVHEPAVCAANLADTLDVLGAVKTIHNQAVDAIEDFIAKATPNRSGVTSPTNEKFNRRG